MFFGVVIALGVQFGILLLVILGVRWLIRPGTALSAVGVRQLFQYALLYGLVIVVAVGATELLARLFGGRPEAWDGADTSLATALGFVVVGGPLLGLLIWWTQKSLRADPTRENSVPYAAYLTVAALTALLVAGFALGPFLGGITTGRFEAKGLATVLVWAGVWAIHWWVAQRTLPEQRNLPHLLLGSAAGLLFAATGFVMVIERVADQLAISGYSWGIATHIMTAAGVMLTGALIWTRYWVTRAQNLPRGPLWMLFALPFGVGGSLVVGLASAGSFLWETLVWFVGDPGLQSGPEYFSETATALGAALAGILIWWYFRAVLGEQVTADPAARRAYLYLVAAIGLATAAGGAVIIIGGFVESLVPALRINTSPINTLLGGIVLLGIGSGTWGVFSRRIRDLVASNPAQEEHAVARKIYLLTWVWAAGVAAVVALIFVAVEAFQVVVSGMSFQDAAYSSRFAVGVVLVASVLSIYHGLQYSPPTRHTPSGPRSVILVSKDPRAAVELRNALGPDVPVHEREVLLEVGTAAEAAAQIQSGYQSQDVVVLIDTPARTPLEDPLESNP